MKRNKYIGAITLDIETSSVNIDDAALRIWGVHHLDSETTEYGVAISQLQSIINESTIIIGHNIKYFDIPILQRLGLTIPKSIIIIDTWEILAPRPLRPDDPPGKGRAAIIGELRLDGLTDNRLPNYKLGTIIEHFSKIFEGRYEFTNKKGSFDYKKLSGPLTPKEFTELREYLKQDLLAVTDLFYFLDDYFTGFKDYLPPSDNARMCHITASTASIAYKAICHRLGLPEEYGEKDRDSFDGAFVIEPAGEKFAGDGYVLDFNCLVADTIVKTKSGYKQIKDITRDDILFSINGTETTIKQIHKYNIINTKLIRLHLDNGTSILCTPNHKWPLMNRYGARVEARHIKPSEYLYPTQINIICQETEPHPEKWEFLGVLICESHLHQRKSFEKDSRHPSGRWCTHSEVIINSKDREPEFTERIKQLLELNNYINYFTFRRTNYSNRGNQNRWQSYLKEAYDILYLFIKENYNINSICKNEERIKSFLKGCFNSDACFNRPYFSILTACDYRCNIYKECFQRLNIRYKYFFNGHHHFYIHSSEMKSKILPWFSFVQPYRNSKIVFPKTQRGIMGVKILNVTEELYTGEIYCPEVNDNSHTFECLTVISGNSQHPHHQWSANLFSPASNKEISEGKYYSGDGTIFKLNGKYSIAQHGEVEKLLKEWFMLRKEYKKNKDPREYTLKILLNGSYGISASAVFASIYYEHAGPDTTLMSKQSSGFMKKIFEEAGYKVIAGDTDSLFVMDPFHDKDRLLKVKADGIKQIRAALPFSDDTYDMGVDAEFSHIFFFKNPNYDPSNPNKTEINEYLKKTYIYITKAGKLKIKGGPLIKSDATRLGKHVFKKYIIPRIMAEHTISFEKDWIRRSIETEIRNDMSLVARSISVKPPKFYKLPSQLQAQISRKYGEGTHLLVQNIVKGIGEGSKYCLLSEAKDLPISALVLDKTWSELGLFIKEETKQQGLVGWL